MSAACACDGCETGIGAPVHLYVARELMSLVIGEKSLLDRVS